MSGKKQIPGKSANQQKRSAPVPAASAQARKVMQEPSFWARLEESKPRLFLYQKICVFLVAFLVFANGIPNGFNMDDTYYTTKENPVSNMGIKAVKKIFTTHTLYDNNSNSFDYRPIPMLSFALQHQFIGSGPIVSHFISVLLYSFVCLLVFVLLCYWFGASYSWFAFLVTLIYAVHPLHTEVVDNIKNRDELLATFFGLLSMISAWKWYATGKIRHICFSVFLFIVALLCKKTVITYVAVLPIAFYFFSDMPVKKIVLSFFILSASFLLVSRTVNHVLLPKQKRVYLAIENPMYVTHEPIGIKTATASYILGWYSYLHVLPYPLSFYYGYKYVQLLNWQNMLPILSLIIYLLLAFLVIKNIRKKSMIAFGALFYLVCILPYSNLFSPAPGMMAERFAFAASLGYCILLVSVLYYIFKIIPGAFAISKNRRYLLAAILFISIGYATMSIARNTVWKDNWVLYSHDMEHLQNSAKANMLYGEQVLVKNNRLRQKYDRAAGIEKQIYRDSLLQYINEEKPPFLRALAIAPDYNKALNNLAVVYINDDSLELAKKYLLKSIALSADNTDNSNTHYNLGVVYGSLSMRGNNSSFIDSSINEFKTVIKIDPKHATAYRMLSQIYLTQKDTASAIDILVSGINNAPDIPFLYAEVARVYLCKKDTVQAVNYYERQAAMPHPDLGLLQTLQGYFHSKNNNEKENYYKAKINSRKAEMSHND